MSFKLLHRNHACRLGLARNAKKEQGQDCREEIHAINDNAIIIFVMNNSHFLLLFLCFFVLGQCFGTQAPTWLTSNYFQAGNQAVISILTGNTSAPIYVFTFSRAFPSSPNLGYGVKNYRGDDTILQEFYQIRNLGITPTTFTVQVQIYGVTNLYLLTVAYLAVDPTFPHLLNIFVNVPVNYTSGNIVNISSYSNDMTTFTEVIDYSQQAAGRTYNSFPTPYASNVIVLFINCLWIRSLSTNPVQMEVSASVISDTQYSITVSLFQRAIITNLHFSMIFYNADDIASSNKYLIISYQWVETSAGGFTPIPQAFLDNFIMAITQFQATQGSCGFEYQWEFVPATANTTFGVQIQPSVQLSGNCGFSKLTSSLFYLQTWQCDSPYLYFNSSSNLCQDVCSSTYFGSNATYTCTPCFSPICLICSNSTDCISCDPTQYALTVNSTCICQDGYFMFSLTCNPCSTVDQYCTICTYNGNYSDTTLNSSLFVCTTCNSTSGYFLDLNFGICLPCSLPNCLNCSSLIACSVCDPASNTMLDSSFHCSTCVVIGCLVCGATPNICVTCNVANGYVLTGGTCSLCAVACICGGYTFPKQSNGDCSTICGDGLILGLQQCDDGNNVSGDGCSLKCKIENYFTCYSQPSLCYVSTPFSLALVSTTVSSVTCNIIAFTFAITPYIPLLDRSSINWSGFLTLTATNLNLISTSYSSGQLTTTYSYSSTLEGQSVSYQLNPLNLLPATIYFSQVGVTSGSLVVHSESNIAAVLNSNSICAAKEALTSVVYASEGVSYLALLVSLFSCKIVGLELFGVLQLSFLVLSNDDNVNQLLASILGRKEVNGPQVPMSISELSNVSNRVRANGFSSEIFLSNFNIMFLLNLLTCIIGAVTYAITYVINKDTYDGHQENGHQEETRSTYLHRLSKYTLKQGMLTLIMFNAFNLSFSTGLQIKYLNQVDSLSIICMLISLTLLVGMIGGLILTSTPQFGQFFDKFGESKAQSNYMLVSLIYRIILGFLLAVLNEWLQSGFVLLAVNMAFLTYIFLIEPFKQTWQNRRSQAIHVTHFIILFVHLYYRLENDDDPIQTSYLYTPAYCQLTAVGGTIVMSSVMLGRQIYMKYFSASKNQAEHLNTGVSELAHKQPPSFQQSMIDGEQSQ